MSSCQCTCIVCLHILTGGYIITVFHTEGLEEDSLTDVPLEGSKGVVESERELVDENRDLTSVNSEQTNAVQISADALSEPPLQPQKQDRNDNFVVSLML